MRLPREGYLWLTSGFSLGQTTDTPMPNKILNSKREKGWVLTIRKKAIAPYSITLAWKTPWMEEPGRLQSKGSRRVWHDWATSLFTFMHWRKKWQPAPVFLPGESQGRGSLVGCRLWGRTGSDTTEATQQQRQFTIRNIVQFKQPGPAVQLHHLVNILKAAFLDARQRQICNARPSRDSSLGEVSLPLSCKLSYFCCFGLLCRQIIASKQWFILSPYMLFAS